MYKLKINIFLSLFILTGFFISAQTGVTTSDSIISGSIYRKYRLYVPTSYNGSVAVPLLFNLHGYTSNATQQQYYGNFMPIADTANFIMVLPEGTVVSGNQFFNAGFGPGVNDVLFMSDLIDSLKLTYNIDNNSIYSTGMSNGGIMSYYLACNLPNKIAAIASVAGSMLNTWFTSAPNRAFPIMEIHGDTDPTVAYNGDATFAPIDSIIKKWVTFNNCNITPATTNVPDIVTTDGATAVHNKYSGGTNGANVELYKIINGAHTWPGSSIIIGTTCEDFNASVEIWRFFRQYKLNMFAVTTSIAKNTIDTEIEIYPNPAKDVLTVKFPENSITSVNITNILGREIQSKKIIGNNLTQLDIAELPNGIYFVNLLQNSRLISTKKVIKNW